MKSDEYERLKEAEKAHLQKVRALKAQLRDARRRQGLSEALSALDTSAFDDEFTQALRDVQTRNVTAEARFELAMDALDEAEARERQRAETEAFEAEQRRAAAADLVQRMKGDMLSDAAEHVAAGARPQADPPARPEGDAPAAPANSTPEKTIGRARPSRG